MIAKRTIRFFIGVSILLIIISACQGPAETKLSYDGSDTSKKEAVPTQKFEDLFDSTSNSIPIFYNMYLTVEMSSLFEETGVAFISELLNPSEKIENYLTSYKKALNIGTYAVDLSYVKAFQEFDYAGKYFSAMHKLAESLGIPDDFFYDAAKRFERNIGNKDSLAFIANEVYNITDNYLRENNRQNTASLIIVGGWIEAVYLAFNIYLQSDKDFVILEKIADQNNSLNQVRSLISLEDEKNEFIKSILQDMNSLQDKFDLLAKEYRDQKRAEKLISDIYDQISIIRNDIIK